MSFEKGDDKSRLPDLPIPKQSFDSYPGELEPLVEEEEEEEDDERHSLPAFPDSPMHNTFSQAAIKDAVSEKDGALVELPHKGGKIVEMEEWNPDGNKKEDDDGGEFPEPPPTKLRELNYTDKVHVPSKEKSGDIFVKIDKFRAARKSLDEVKGRLDEVEDLLRKIRETKIREEQELSGWEREMAQVKARISDVNDNIFSKVD